MEREVKAEATLRLISSQIGKQRAARYEAVCDVAQLDAMAGSFRRLPLLPSFDCAPTCSCPMLIAV